MNDTLIFLLLAGIALIFKWLSSHASGDSKKPEPPLPNDQRQRPPAQSDEERVRRFLEALGQAPGSQPPPPVRPRTGSERRTVAPRPPPKVRRDWARPLPPLETVPPPAPVLLEAAPTQAIVPPPVVTRPPVVRPAALVVPALSKTSSLGAMLRSRRSVRDAILLREILGPPRGLQAPRDLRSF